MWRNFRKLILSALTPLTVLVIFGVWSPQLAWSRALRVSSSNHPTIVKRGWDWEREMESDGPTASSGLSGAVHERGAGGKIRKPPPRKPPSTPYSRPPQSQGLEEAGGRRRWLSKLVDPAYRLISSGATRIIPLFFSTPASSNALPSPSEQDHRKLISLSVTLEFSFCIWFWEIRVLKEIISNFWAYIYIYILGLAG